MRQLWNQFSLFGSARSSRAHVLHIEKVRISCQALQKIWTSLNSLSIHEVLEK